MRKLAIVLILFSGSVLLTHAQKGKVTSASNYLTNNEIEKAWEAIQVAEKNPKTENYPKTYYVKGQILQKIGESKDEKIKALAENPLEKAYESYQKAIKLDEKGKMNKAIDFQLPMLNNDFINQGVGQFQDKDFAGALKSFEYSLEIGKNPVFAGLVDTSIVYNAALAAYNGKDYENALKYFGMAKDMNYGGISIYQLMERVYFAQGDSASAESLMQEGIEAFPDNNDLMIELINYYLISNQDDKAFEYLKKALKNEPDNANYWYVQGVLYDKRGELEEAMKSYLKSTELDPTYYNPYYNAGVIKFNEGVSLWDKANQITDNTEFEKAKKVADKAFSESVPYFEKALENATTDVQKRESMENLKVLYYRLQMMDKREEIIKKLDELDSGN